jgi:site-specific DNA recombinase
MIQNTGKGGLYRYSCCSSKLKKGPSACRGLRTPMEKLDDIVGEVARQVLYPNRLTAMLEAYVSSRPRLRRKAHGGARKTPP